MYSSYYKKSIMYSLHSLHSATQCKLLNDHSLDLDEILTSVEQNILADMVKQRYIDSLPFLPMKLSNLPESYGNLE